MVLLHYRVFASASECQGYLISGSVVRVTLPSHYHHSNTKILVQTSMLPNVREPLCNHWRPLNICVKFDEIVRKGLGWCKLGLKCILQITIFKAA